MGLYSAMAPLALLLLSSLWQYPAVLEEVVKWGVLRTGPEKGNGFLVGLIFGISETILFTTNAWTGGQWHPIFLRLLLTVPMHVLTAMLIAWGMQKRLTVAMLIVAMLAHATFNYLAKFIL